MNAAYPSEPVGSSRTSSRNERSTRPILIVDDHLEFRDPLAELLRAEGYPVEMARSGLEALDMLRWGLRPRVILLDLQMQRMTGWEFRAEQNKDAALAPIPVIAMTAGYWKAGDLADFPVRIEKPFKLEELQGILKQYR
jgi:CheY-like chemotaxis protein